MTNRYLLLQAFATVACRPGGTARFPLLTAAITAGNAGSGVPAFSPQYGRLLAALLVAMAIAHAVPAQAQATPSLLGTMSRKVHAAAGTFDLTLGNAAANPTTEPRLGPTHTIIFTFDGVVTAGTAAVTEGTATVGVPTFSGSELIVPLTGVSNVQYVGIAVSNVSTAGGGTGGNGAVRVGLLAGDVNQSRVVSLADLGLVNAQLSQVVTALNYLKDVNASGTLTLADKGLTNARLTQALPAPGGGALPPDPVTVVTPVEPGVVSDIGVDTRFLYTGPNPIQTGVLLGTIDRLRAAVLRGKVLDRAGAVLTGVTISILDHPELGQTLSRADGRFDMAVTGGGLLTLNYGKVGFLPVQRQIRVPLRVYREVDEVVMIPLDVQVTPIVLNAPAMQVHRGSAVTDADGVRTATLLIPPGTTAQLVMSDGSTQPLASLNVRATEYTVGVGGPKAMPAQLPPTSGYTYAVELSADEVSATGARRVEFSQPLANYVENFLGFPVGMAVPTGFYDRTKAAWIPSVNGRIVRIAAINAGVADVDSVGTGTLPTLVLSIAERQQLAALYPVGRELWRVPVSHFTPWDHNWPFGLPADAIAPNAPTPSDVDERDNPTCSAGSVIECENQTLGERIGLVGTPHSLNYRSTRVPGRTAEQGLLIELSSADVPASLKRIDLAVQVAGRNFRQSFAPGPNQQTLFIWDGLDAYGRALQGSQPATIDIGYAYDAVYLAPDRFDASFGGLGTTTLAANPARSEITITQTLQLGIGRLDARMIGLGGWSLGLHHVYDPSASVLHLGSGGRRGSKSIGAVIQNVKLQNPDGTPAASPNPQSIAVGPDGTVYLAALTGDSGSFVTEIKRITPDGRMFPFAAVAHLGHAQLALGPEGSLYLVQGNFGEGSRITRFAPDGSPTLIVETPEGFGGDGGPVSQAQFGRIEDAAVADDGSVYVADGANERIRRIGPDGIVTTVAGTGVRGFSGDGGLATQAQLNQPLSVAVGPDGSFFVREATGNRIRRVGPDGLITTIAGTGASCGDDVPLPCGDGGPAKQASLNGGGNVNLALGPDGTLYIAEINSRIRQIGADGIIRTVAGRGGFLAVPFVDGMPATQAQLNINDGDIAVAPDGTLYIAAAGPGLRRVVRSLPGLATTDVAVASEDGGQLYVFDSRGRHLRTLQSLTGATLSEFVYDAAGRLTQVTEKTGGTDNVTVIERDAAGNPTAIVAPFGQRTILGLDANGFLATVTNPAAEAIQFVYTSNGLLTSLTDPRGKTSTFAYDSDGRLERDTDAVGGFQSFARTATAGEFTVTRTTALARSTTYKVEDLPGHIEKRTVTAPDGTQLSSQESIGAGNAEATAPDGTLSNLQRGPDPRFGMQTPLANSLTIALPGGPTLTTANKQTMVSGNPLDPFGFTSLTATSTVAGRTWTSTYSAANRTEVTTTPAGRAGALTVDAFGRPVQSQAGGLEPATFVYDIRGRIANMTRGSGPTARTYLFGYNAQGFLATITDPIGRIVQFTYDAAGRVISKSLPDGRVTGFGYDAAGNLTSLTPPGRPAHTFGYSDRSELTLATPAAVPGTGPSSFSFNLDNQLTTTARPDNRIATIGYDAAGRPTSRAFATGGVITATDTLSYDVAGRIASVVAASGLISSFAYTGSLLTGESWSGSTAGSVTASYDTSFRLASQSVNGANPITFSYDNDSLVIAAGNLTIARDPQSGLPMGSTLGVVSTANGYSGFGEVTSHAASANASAIYSLSFVRDPLGRVSQKTETIGGVTDTYVYVYDVAGQVIVVSKNGSNVENYSYDANGNRINTDVGGVSTTSAYDDQDRLTSAGTTTFTYTAAGELLSKTAGGQVSTYQYDQVGNLLGATLPGGTAVTYVVDGLDRRVGKRVNATNVQGLLYDDSRRPVAELDALGALVSRFVYAGGNAPAIVIKGGIVHRVLTDHVGSVRVVVNAVTGAIAQRIDYDTFGNVILDTSPGFQPFGFAGGIYDSDTGLVRFGARDYDSSIGRWTAKDPIGFSGGDTNLYRYVHNDPVNLVDRSGKMPAPNGGPDIEDIARAFENAITKVTRALNPETGEHVETAVEFTQRRQKIAIARRAANLIQDGGREAAECMKAGAKFVRKGLKGIGPILGYFDVIKRGIEGIANDEEVTLEEYAEAYLGQPIEFSSGTPGMI